jgi:hypothetical protein
MQNANSSDSHTLPDKVKVGSRHMQNANSSDSHTLPDKVKVDLDVFGALMLHRIGGEIDGTHIVTVNECGTHRRVVELLK